MHSLVENLYLYYRNIDVDFRREDFFLHSHDYFEIYLFHQGDCKYLINDHVVQLQQNDIIVMNGSALHGPSPKEGIAYERSVIEFSPEWIKPILKTLNVPELLTPFDQLTNTLFRNIDPCKFEEIHALLKKIHMKQLDSQIPKKNKTEKRMVKGEVTTLLVELLFILYELSKSKLDKVMLGNTDKKTHVDKIISWIDHHFQYNVTLDDISNNLHISKYYMSRIFKDITGITVMQYLMQRRLLRSKYLLEMHPEKTILDVALESGFESASHFSRRFRKYFNVAPSEYRNKGIDEKDTDKFLKNLFEQ
ncbi:AraC family transcriptional regulator [Gracilibacillus sp. YIM 98692]|uniref:AraC family transcriptional regulator n=1 Tax=Gracilibacillus sp. YIM 98692 TaxID=2663532 RepID=UPI0013D15055|nr:AraC family transcriptional regulator [Gracilibacillus sp. YIM 98692]